MINKIIFGSSLFFSILAFAGTVENVGDNDVEPVPVCTGGDCPEGTNDVPVKNLEQVSENK